MGKKRALELQAIGKTAEAARRDDSVAGEKQGKGVEPADCANSLRCAAMAHFLSESSIAEGLAKGDAADCKEHFAPKCFGINA